MSNRSEKSEHSPDGCGVDDGPRTKPVKESALYAQRHVSGDLHPAFVEPGLSYDVSSDRFVPEVDDVQDEAALFASQLAFTDALAKYQQDVKVKYKSGIDLGATHDWDDVMKYVNEARDRYTGVGEEGIMKKIDNRLKTFQTAAPAIQAWLKLLPSTSTYGSVVCGGLTIILEAAVRLRKLRKETLDALDQVPLCIEKAQFFMRMYGYEQVYQQTCNLYLAIIEALRHILEFYERAAGMKYLSAFSKGPAYAEVLINKMRKVEKASQAMDERVNQREHRRLKDIWDLAVHTKNQVGDLKSLAAEARNHLYAVLRDTEVWQQEALQAWKQPKARRESGGANKARGTFEQEDPNMTARKALLAQFQPDHIDQSRDVANVLTQMTSMTLDDQDRVGAIVDHQAVTDWLLDPRFPALLVHGNGRRHDRIAPTSVACALLIHVFSTKLRFPTLYWYCGLHDAGLQGNPSSMLKNLICQLLSLSCCVCSLDDQLGLNTQDFAKMIKLFVRLLRSSSLVAPVVCVLDGISFYEARHQRVETSELVEVLAGLAQSEPTVLLLLLTSPLRTNYISQRSKKAPKLIVAEIPDHVSGYKQGLNSRHIVSSTEERANARLESLVGRR
ncbi:hypothetical protein XPA_006275 [Xanthoria parietina]